MYVYTSAAETYISTNKGRDIDADATLSMLSSQQVLDNSLAGIRLELVRVHRIEYGTADLSPFLDMVQGNSAPANEIRAICNAEDIDIVVAVSRQSSSNPSAAGLASLLTSQMNCGSGAVSVAIDCVYTYSTWTVIHEIAHIFGCEHHRKQIISPGQGFLFKYSTAWKGSIPAPPPYGGSRVTVMGYEGYMYNDDNSYYYSRIPYFSVSIRRTLPSTVKKKYMEADSVTYTIQGKELVFRLF